MGITADDYKRVVNRMLYLEEQLKIWEANEEMRRNILRDVATRLEHLQEDFNTRNVQYTQLLDFYNGIKELSYATGDEWTFIWSRHNSGVLGSFVWSEDEDALPKTFHSEEDATPVPED